MELVHSRKDTRKVHYRKGDDSGLMRMVVTACDVLIRANRVTIKKEHVTCGNCKRTHEYRGEVAS